RRERPADERRHAERLEEVAADEQGVNRLRLAAGLRQREWLRVGARERPVEEVRALPHLIPNRVSPRRSSVESGAGHRHEAPGLGDRKGAQEDGVDERKNGGVGSYAER